MDKTPNINSPANEEKQPQQPGISRTLSDQELEQVNGGEPMSIAISLAVTAAYEGAKYLGGKVVDKGLDCILGKQEEYDDTKTLYKNTQINRKQNKVNLGKLTIVKKVDPDGMSPW